MRKIAATVAAVSAVVTLWGTALAGTAGATTADSSPALQPSSLVTKARPDARPHRARSARAGLEHQVLTLTNRQRRAHGCRPLHANHALTTAARRHSARMAGQGRMVHVLRGERGLVPRIRTAGYRRWSRLAENIAVGYPSASSVVHAWMSSPPHRRNLLDCRLRDLGVGTARRGGIVWWTQDFGRH